MLLKEKRRLLNILENNIQGNTFTSSKDIEEVFKEHLGVNIIDDTSIEITNVPEGNMFLLLETKNENNKNIGYFITYIKLKELFGYITINFKRKEDNIIITKADFV